MTGKGLQAWREQYGFSVHELAAALRVDVGKIDLWERSKEPVPTYLQIRLNALVKGRSEGGAGDQATL